MGYRQGCLWIGLLFDKFPQSTAGQGAGVNGGLLGAHHSDTLPGESLGPVEGDLDSTSTWGMGEPWRMSLEPWLMRPV